MQEELYDLAVVGGGINGCGIARDAAGRGLRVLLVEAADLGGGTSSASTKLIHGGLRYLEYYEFRLVREALRERERLWRLAPHLVRPLRFVLPHHAGLRPAWELRAGLFLYDHLGGRRALPPTRSVDLRSDPVGRALQERYRKGFEYSDCQVDDARLVVANAVDAAERGAEVRVRTSCRGAKRADGGWVLALGGDPDEGGAGEVRARVLVNAAGPWVANFAGRVEGAGGAAPVRLVKGSHVVVPRLFEHEKAYLFQNADGRIGFAIPFQGDYTLLGTTDVDFSGDPRTVSAGTEEIDYICALASEYLARPVERAQVVHSYAGVRALYDDGASEAKAATRDYVLRLDTGAGAAPLLSVYGGKITTYRRLAEHALRKLARWLPGTRGEWTDSVALPGGDFAPEEAPALAERLRARCPALSARHARRLVAAYGRRAERVLLAARGREDLGEHFGADLYAAEVEYLMREEWARSAEDVLWRRSKLGLKLSAAEADALERWMARRRERHAA